MLKRSAEEAEVHPPLLSMWGQRRGVSLALRRPSLKVQHNLQTQKAIFQLSRHTASANARDLGLTKQDIKRRGRERIYRGRPEKYCQEQILSDKELNLAEGHPGRRGRVLQADTRF